MVGKEIGTLKGLRLLRACLAAQLVKNPSAMQETWVRSLGWEDPLEKGTATHSSIPTPVIWSGEFHGLCSPWGHKESDMTEQLSLYFHKFKQKKKKRERKKFLSCT